MRWDSNVPWQVTNVLSLLNSTGKLEGIRDGGGWIQLLLARRLHRIFMCWGQDLQVGVLDLAKLSP